jgi:hypothetical protein
MPLPYFYTGIYTHIEKLDPELFPYGQAQREASTSPSYANDQQTSDSNLATPITSGFTQEISAVSNVQVFARAHPELFLVACRANCMALKDVPEWRISLSSNGSKLILHDTNTIMKNSISTAGIETGEGVLLDKILNRVEEDKCNKLQVQLDYECRQNQAIFHTNLFVMDAVFKVFKDQNLTAKETYDLRALCMRWHRDFQHRFLFKHLYEWCKDFAAEHPECWDLCEKKLKVDKEAAAVFKVLLTNAMGKATFRAVWKIVADIIDYNATFQADDFGTYPLAHFFMRVVLGTIAPMILRLIKRERLLNEGRETNEKERRDSTFRAEIIETYKSLSIAPIFQDVDKDIFVWIKPSVKQRRIIKADRNLDSWLWESERPPPPPTNRIRRPPVPSFSPSSSDLASSPPK